MVVKESLWVLDVTTRLQWSLTACLLWSDECQFLCHWGAHPSSVVGHEATGGGMHTYVSAGRWKEGVMVTCSSSRAEKVDECKKDISCYMLTCICTWDWSNFTSSVTPLSHFLLIIAPFPRNLQLTETHTSLNILIPYQCIIHSVTQQVAAFQLTLKKKPL